MSISPDARFSRKELHASFLGGEAGGEARRASGPVAAVRDFLCREDLLQVFGGGFGQQSLDARDLDRVDAAAAG